jgi:hypothetical protein
MKLILGERFTLTISEWFLLRSYRKVKSKSKAVPLHAMEAHGGRENIAPTLLNLGTRWGGGSGQLHAPAVLNPGEGIPTG